MRPKYVKFLAASFFIIFLDRITKIYFYYNQPEAYNFGLLKLHYLINYGAAFSILQGQRILLVAMPIFVMFLILYYLKGTNKKNIAYYGMLFLFAGATGNLIDRLFFGYVIDFIDLSFFPAVFNVADISNTIGAMLILISLFKKEK